MNVESAASAASAIARTVLAPSAADSDKQGRFSIEAVEELGRAGLLGLMLPVDVGGSSLGPRAFAGVVAALAEVDASVAMVFLMHTLASVTIAAAPRTAALEEVLRAMAGGRHLSTLAFSETGSRSHFWAPISRAESLDGGGARLSARKSFVTSAGHAQSYVTSALSHTGSGLTDSTLYLVLAGSEGVTVAGAWDGLGLRANASSPMVLERCVVPADRRLTAEGGGFQTMLDVVLPLFNLGQAAVSLGLCRAAVAATIAHLKSARFEHLGSTSLGEALPTLRAQLATMQIETDGLLARLDDAIGHLEQPGELTMLRVLEVKAAAGETAIAVTSLAMRACGGAAFSRHTGIERFFRDAHAGAVMAPTNDVLREFIGRALLGLPLF
ncbi:MAG TPA: acyl-CoA dehydrogenase family protein [Gemmatimonadaceae bacterium]|nr:acyl-CoA dehydrogenase family protein [Gemmatimonadaceae bacterium]